MQCVHDGSLAAANDRLRRLAELVADPRWIYRFELVRTSFVPERPQEPKHTGRIATHQLRAVAQEVLASPSTDSVMFSVSRKEAQNDAYFEVDVGRRDVYGSHAASAEWRLPEDDAEAKAASWIELQHSLIETLGASHGVLITATNPYVMLAEVSLIVTSIDGRAMHPDPAEMSSYNTQRDKLGSQYIRKPRWGTYLKPGHVAAVGGRARILDVVKPPITRDVGELWYVQLSERVADAMTPETKARWRAFAERVAPITMPR